MAGRPVISGVVAAIANVCGAKDRDVPRLTVNAPLLGTEAL